MGRTWLLVVALVLVALWAARALFAPAWPGLILFLTSFGLPLAGLFLVLWWIGRKRGSRTPNG